MLNGFAAGAGPSPRIVGAGAAGCAHTAVADNAAMPASRQENRKHRVRMMVSYGFGSVAGAAGVPVGNLMPAAIMDLYWTELSISIHTCQRVWMRQPLSVLT